jgi:hypothetical protein
MSIRRRRSPSLWAWVGMTVAAMWFVSACRGGDATPVQPHAPPPSIQAPAAAPPPPAAQVAPALPAAPQVPAPPPMPSVSGTWLSMFGGGVMADGTPGPSSPVTLTLVQVGGSVSGQYVATPGGGTAAAPGTVSGTLTGDVLTGTWRDTAGAAGTFRFEIAQGGVTFTGVWTGNGGGGGSWNGQRDTGSTNPAPSTPPSTPPSHQETPQGFTDIRGTWLTDFELGGRSVAMRLTLFQNMPGNRGFATRIRSFRERPCMGSPGLCVSGLYQYVGGGGSGSLFGVLDETTGDFFLGDWQDVSGGHGGVTFRFNRDAQSFSGAWYSKPVGTPGSRRLGYWNGRRLSD